MEDAAVADSRRHSVGCPDDSFFISSYAAAGGCGGAPAPTESESASQLISHIKLLLRRTAAVVAALDAGLPTEAARSFSKVLCWDAPPAASLKPLPIATEGSLWNPPASQLSVPVSTSSTPSTGSPTTSVTLT
ncbi:DNAJ heat shock N-terminal domain-containing protein [Musa troglodytarum]|uniref:DNAJ heat shock N-terminal domain-containing protein n=1 Tax=Musa troglodytarum TaxID=320322 RepID=A0A9E7KGC2_9LILI|nr:DNAJ heat shock N-terminal domain-containing protein [Musa troglodytarum]